jgi:hypothetical protein
MGEAKRRRELQGGTWRRQVPTAIPDGIKADIAIVVQGVVVAGFAPGSQR